MDVSVFRIFGFLHLPYIPLTYHKDGFFTPMNE